MRNLLYISLVVLAAGCSSELTGPPQPQSGNLFSYFWPDSTATYEYLSSTGGIQTLTIRQGTGEVTDLNDTISTILTIDRSTSGYAMSGFGSHDLFQLNASMQIVHDTILPAVRTEFIRSIAALNTHFGSALYASTDSTLYQIDLTNNTLTNPNALPEPGLRLAEDVGGVGVYAFHYGGREIFFTTNGGAKWSADSTPLGTSITAFTSTYYKGGDLFWVACGTQLFEFNFFTANANPNGKLVSCPLSTITALEASPDDGDIIAADDAGNVYNVSQSRMLYTTPSGVRAMAGTYATTNVGVFDYVHGGPPVVSSDDSAIYFTGLSIFAGRQDGSVDHFSGTGPNNNLAAPDGGAMVTQFAYPVVGPRDPDKGVYALAAGQVFYRVDALHWAAVNQLVTPMGKFSPGSLTLLQPDTGSWVAGYLETTAYNGKQKGYGYRAKAYAPFATDEFDGTPYENVLLVTYRTESNGVSDTANVPQYNIYYQKGNGPIRIERTFNGKTTITTRQQ